ncbi:hypothetical protein CAPTEDRAFT_211372 [Capitella teleta]|uniref:Uncharacterized protein n=1 Tax=Capitella teleta TaxID=283909 RepID=R7U368_CAPTE|nr:hypothetical protein CAPTEDRAFT_211372 [Capitella teleta]|eukprot:ELU00551.1 hypothetical protein CAPTEDRAFT_211372 [Capitella teleta]
MARVESPLPRALCSLLHQCCTVPYWTCFMLQLEPLFVKHADPSEAKCARHTARTARRENAAHYATQTSLRLWLDSGRDLLAILAYYLPTCPAGRLHLKAFSNSAWSDSLAKTLSCLPVEHEVDKAAVEQLENNPITNSLDFIWASTTVAVGDTAVLHCSFDAIFQQLRNGNMDYLSIITAPSRDQGVAPLASFEWCVAITFFD